MDQERKTDPGAQPAAPPEPAAQETPDTGAKTDGDAGEKETPPSKKAGKSKKKDEVAALAAELEDTRRQLGEQTDAYQRMLAEYANYKRRTEQEKEQLGSFVKAETLKALLPALDNLERAVEAPPGDEYKAGVDMTIRQLGELLAKLGLEEITAQGAPFDPEVHNAVMREDADGVEPDTVTEVYQKGYAYAGRVLRPAMVKVAN